MTRAFVGSAGNLIMGIVGSSGRDSLVLRESTLSAAACSQSLLLVSANVVGLPGLTSQASYFWA